MTTLFTLFDFKNPQIKNKYGGQDCQLSTPKVEAGEHEFEATLSYRMRPYIKKKKKKPGTSGSHLYS
jgi:hypothetical protein